MWFSRSFQDKDGELMPQPAVGEKLLEKKTSAKTNFIKSSLKSKRVSHSPADEYHYKKVYDFGWPNYALSDTIIEHSAYALSYNEKYEQANWVAWQLTKDELHGKQKRKDHFVIDRKIATGSADPNDYKKSGYDRGHLAPAADFSFDKKAMAESFYMSNMSPQVPALNRGVWKILEEQTREWAESYEELYIVTGPVFSENMKTIGKNKVAVPSVYFKVILDFKEPDLKAIGFLMKNEGSEHHLQYFAVSVDSVEELSQLNFFPLIPDSLEEKLESSKDSNLWFKNIQ